jgi:hypothetical protein
MAITNEEPKLALELMGEAMDRAKRRRAEGRAMELYAVLRELRHQQSWAHVDDLLLERADLLLDGVEGRHE